jgi:hypothetical protein
MAGQHHKKIEDVKTKIRARIGDGIHRPGDRFLSTRALASTFGISYQTAHRLAQELCDEGLLERRATSGTYIPGGHKEVSRVRLFFNERARRPHSFGARLLDGLTKRLSRDETPWEIVWTGEAHGDKPADLGADCFPILWESPAVVAQCFAHRRAALLLNDRPQPGLPATFMDSVSIDDFSGGASAAQLLLRELPSGRRALAVLSGPRQDRRGNDRRDGFLSVVPYAPVVPASGWYFDDGYAAAEAAVKAGREGLFCGNDRLAEAVTAYCRDHDLACPRLVGFDDAPVAEDLDLTTIAIPWDEMTAGAVDIVRKRLAGDTSTARQLILTPRPVVRRL